MTRGRGRLGYRLGVASRGLAAAAGGYSIAALTAILLAVGLPGDPLNRAMTGTLLALLVLPLVAVPVFWVRSAGRAWAIVAGTLISLAFLSFRLGWRP